MSEVRTLRRWVVAATVLSATAGVMVLVPGTAEGDVGGLGFAATAAANPFRISTKLANFPASDTPVDSGGPSAQAALGTSGGGMAYAASPDPGVFLSVLPQLGKGVLEQNGVALPFSAPDYPLAIQANAQAPSKEVGSGGYELAADVTPSSAESRAKTGAESPGGNVGLVDAAAEIVKSSDGVAAKAISDIDGLTVGPLSIGSVRSVVSIVSDASGTLTRSSSFAVDALKIGDLPVGLAPGGFTFLGQPVPGDQAAELNGLLEAGGVTLEQFPVTETENGLIGAGLIITHRFDSPSFGATTIRYRVGGAAVDLNVSGSTAAFPAGTTPAGATAGPALTGTDGSPGSIPALVAAPSAVSLPVPSGTVGAGPLSGQFVAGGDVPASAGATSAEIPTVQLAPVSAARLPERVDENLYLVIVLAGLLGFGVTRVIRMAG